MGGKTIQEAKENMSMDEAVLWREYRESRGVLNTARRLDTALTKLTFYTLAIAGNKEIKLEDMLWWEHSITEEIDNKDNSESSSLEQMLMLLKTQSNNKTKTTTKFKRT